MLEVLANIEKCLVAFFVLKTSSHRSCSHYAISDEKCLDDCHQQFTHNRGSYRRRKGEKHGKNEMTLDYFYAVYKLIELTESRSHIFQDLPLVDLCLPAVANVFNTPKTKKYFEIAGVNESY
jgi:hypothetical protein